MNLHAIRHHNPATLVIEYLTARYRGLTFEFLENGTLRYRSTTSSFWTDMPEDDVRHYRQNSVIWEQDGRPALR